MVLHLVNMDARSTVQMLTKQWNLLKIRETQSEFKIQFTDLHAVMLLTNTVLHSCKEIQ